jgi:6-phosphofructokinase 1
MSKISKLGILTSGGDSPGMNACIRAVVRTAIYHNIEVRGIMHGYDGLIDGDFISMDAKSVSNIIQRGGTILKTARSPRFMTKEGMDRAYRQLVIEEIDALIVIGGNGTFKGADEFGKTYNFPIVGIAGTIDNDLFGTDFTIGYDTALNTVIDAVDKIRETAESHERIFIVEVMGKDAGLIALRSGIGSGAEAILIPESKNDLSNLINRLDKGRKNKASKIIIVAEGDDSGGAYKVADAIKEKYDNFDIRVTVLGHIQRGGTPSCSDRVLASRLGFAAVEALKEQKKNCMIGIINREIAYTPFEKAVKHIEELNQNLLRMVEILSL